MHTIFLGALVVCIFIAIYYLRPREQYQVCKTGTCERNNRPRRRIDVLNPFVYPFSATGCPEDLSKSWYLPTPAAPANTIDPRTAENSAAANNSVFSVKSVPDHEVKTN